LLNTIRADRGPLATVGLLSCRILLTADSDITMMETAFAASVRVSASGSDRALVKSTR